MGISDSGHRNGPKLCGAARLGADPTVAAQARWGSGSFASPGPAVRDCGQDFYCETFFTSRYSPGASATRWTSMPSFRSQ